MFINCLTATANDICKEQKRQTISADDIIAALQDLELGELVTPLKDALERAPFAASAAFMLRCFVHRIWTAASHTSRQRVSALRRPCACWRLPCFMAQGVMKRHTKADLCARACAQGARVRAGFRNDSKEKSKRKAEQVKKRKAEAAPPPLPAAAAQPVQGFAVPYAGHAHTPPVAQAPAQAAPAPATAPQPSQGYSVPYGAAGAGVQPYASAAPAQHFTGVPGGLQLTPQFVAQFAASFPAQFQVRGPRHGLYVRSCSHLGQPLAAATAKVVAPGLHV